MPDSFDYTTGTNSENVRLLQALIDDAPEYTEETNSRNANILKSIINNTEYTDAPQSEIEELLLRLKAKIGGEIEVDELNVTENGTYDAGVNKAYNPVKVELPLDGKTITENGTYTASDDNLAGFNEVTVAVEGYAKKSISNTPTDIATFNASALPMPSLKIGIEPIQEGSGDPSPTNVRPISGHTEANVSDVGKNFIGKGTLLNGFVNTATMQFNEDSNSVGYYFNTNDLPDEITFNAVNGNRAYYGYFNVIPKDGAVCLDVNQSQQTLPRTITVDKTYKYIHLQFSYNQSVTNVQVEKGTTATNFVPYNPDSTTYTIDLDGTRYGGKLDVVSGVMTVDRVSITVDENSNIISGSGGLPFRLDSLTGAKASSSASALTGVKCNLLKEVTQSSSWGVDGTFSRVTTDAKIVYFKVDSEITTIQQLKTFLQSNKLQFVYELATPLTIQLTPTAVKSLLGTNNLWADSGQVLSGEYLEAL